MPGEKKTIHRYSALTDKGTLTGNQTNLKGDRIVQKLDHKGRPNPTPVCNFIAMIGGRIVLHSIRADLGQTEKTIIIRG